MVRRLGYEAALMTLFIVWSLSSFEVNTLSGAVRNTVFSLVDYWVPAVLAIRLVSAGARTRWLFLWVVIPAICIAAISVYEYIVQWPIIWDFFNNLHTPLIVNHWEPVIVGGRLRVQASFGQPIFLAFYLACASVMLLSLAPYAKGLWRIATIGGSALLGIVSLLPLARGAMVGLLAAVVVLVIFGTRRGRVLVLGVIVAGILVLWAGAPLLSGANSYWADFILTLAGQARSDVQAQQLRNVDSRFTTAQVGLLLLQRAPVLGYGDINLGGRTPLADVANVFLEVGLQSGLVGLGLFVAYLLFVYRNLIRRWASAKNTSGRQELAALLAITSLLVVCMLDSSWPGQFSQIIWIVLGWSSFQPRGLAAQPELSEPEVGSRRGSQPKSEPVPSFVTGRRQAGVLSEMPARGLDGRAT